MASVLQLSLVDDKEWFALKQKFAPLMSTSEECRMKDSKYTSTYTEGELIPPVSTETNENLRQRKFGQ